MVWTLIAVAAFLAIPGIFDGMALGQTGDAGGNGIGVLDFMDIRDSDGVRATSYQFSTDEGSLFEPGNTMRSALIHIELQIWLFLQIPACEFVGFAAGYEWLDPFHRAMIGVAEGITRQVATPLVLITAAAIGSLIVALFIARGFYSRATTQICFMLLVAVLSPVFLAEPLAEVLSPDGLLAQGRDLGISVAAGLNGNANPNPADQVEVMQAGLVDNLVRHPLQTWNFGHVVDRSPVCREAWSAAVVVGDGSDIREAMRDCGDSAAHARASEPSWGQVGSGLVIILLSPLASLVLVILSFMIVRDGCYAIYHGFMMIFGFAAGGFIYGPTQNFLIRNVVDAFVAAGRMSAFTIFLGVYTLFLNNLFLQAGG
ncbi:hypothetical protein [Nocardia mexicana]|uniref:TrbL/VirB6 plasmid conjugal transfer protein n=1 Tax=Nocardia mexicana TaxID=279262 RepID=A0A370GS64_9NOCA|nr:hypothetical protein [Nocardia mexicana]RDI45344.1 hypothetical protein DFR68_113115 [Nocardia mexicana]